MPKYTPEEAELRETIRDWMEMEYFDQVLNAVKAHDKKAAARAWNLALDHVWELNDPIDSLISTASRLPVVTEADIYQARRENPYAQED